MVSLNPSPAATKLPKYRIPTWQHKAVMPNCAVARYSTSQHTGSIHHCSMSHAQAGAGCLPGSVMHQGIMFLVKQRHDCTYTISVAAAAATINVSCKAGR